jgi:molybdopterin-guanine dinucleotide biosynthesis protein A
MAPVSSFILHPSSFEFLLLRILDAVILAGGAMPPSLVPVTSVSERALIEIEGQTLLSRVVDSLRETPAVTRIICVATPEALLSLDSDVIGLPAGDKMTQNLLLGARAAHSERILIVTADAPLVTGQTWTQFLHGATAQSLEAAYPIVRRQAVEAQFPGGKRTYARLKDGVFTGGNAFLLPKDRLEALETVIERAFAARKNPLALARMLGAGFIVRFATRRLTVREIEAKISSLLGCRGGAVVVGDASIAFDVDKPADLVAARAELEKRAREQRKIG